MSFAARMQQIAPSPTLKVTAEADRLRRQGVDVVDLGAGRLHRYAVMCCAVWVTSWPRARKRSRIS